jgi:biotin carboxyl carrier protein
MKKLRVTVDGKVYEVLVEILGDAPSAGAPAVPVAPVSNAPVAPAPAPAPAPSTDAGAIVSPLAGKVVSIDVQPGQTLAEGAQVATIEAMKMNTYIYAPKAGRVSEVLAQAGDAVAEGAVLLRLAQE